MTYSITIKENTRKGKALLDLLKESGDVVQLRKQKVTEDAALGALMKQTETGELSSKKEVLKVLNSI